MVKEHFNLSKSVKVLFSDQTVTKSKINKFFKVACNRTGNFLPDFETKISYGDLVYSFRIFRTKGEPSFLSGSKYEEQKFGFCLIVEYKKYIFINSKYCQLNKENLEMIGQTIPFNEFSDFLSNEQTEFQKINLKNTSVLPTAIVNRSLEGNDLARIFSPIYASKNIVRSCKIKNEMGAFSQSLSSSRLTNYSSKSDLNDYLDWCKKIIDFVVTEKTPSNYLKNFSSPIKYEDERDKLLPESIMFDLRPLQDLDLSFIDEKNQEIDILKIFDIYNKTFELNIDNNYIGSFIASIDEDTILTVKKLKKKLKIKISTDIKVRMDTEEGESEIDFESLLVANSIVTFEDIKYSYYAETLFIDNYLVNNKSSFLDNFIVLDGLNKTTSEKGSFSTGQKSFAENSVFGVLENYLDKDYTYIFCDDLSTEYADYIACKKNNIGFYHAKSSKALFSASAFHDVVGQALKNLSYISDLTNITLDEQDNPRDLVTKKEVWKRTYNTDGIKTDICRLRKPKNVNLDEEVQKGIELIRKANSNGQTTRVVALVVDFISKEKMAEEINKNTNKELKQILWILSSFISACQELNLIPQILCKK
ncbi:hypothetical protein ACTXNW_10165 [Enterococcus malodoratus]|uniref:hypothetical protein n=1 Tax=Enterococcus malodoratus TaxID=71451 RepID=UPI003FCFB3FC